jgi:hypothetical protein
VDGVGELLDSEVGSLSMSYLGLPLMSSFKTKTFWDVVIVKSEE